MTLRSFSIHLLLAMWPWRFLLLVGSPIVLLLTARRSQTASRERQPLRRAIRRLRPNGATEQGRAFYDQRYARANKRLPYHLQPYYGLWCVIADRLKGSADVLEVGSGAGHLAALLLDQGLTQYTGFDLSPAAVEIAHGHRPDLDVRVADAFDTDLFDTATYDTIVCTEVLEHIDRDRELIAQWPTGVRCLCSVPDFPGKAHVRHFDSAEEVAARYRALFAPGLTVTTVVRASERPARVFLLDGHRA